MVNYYFTENNGDNTVDVYFRSLVGLAHVGKDESRKSFKLTEQYYSEVSTRHDRYIIIVSTI